MGMVSESRGLSLRFPRFIKVRDDKSIVDASTPDFVAQMWRDQQGKGKDKAGVDEGELVDVDMEEEVAEDEERATSESEEEIF
jgi:DNA ligase-1